MNLTFHVYIADLEMLSRVIVFIHFAFSCMHPHLTYCQPSAMCQHLDIVYKADILVSKFIG